MSDVCIIQKAQPLQAFFKTAPTPGSGFPTIAPTSTEPLGDGVVQLESNHTQESRGANAKFIFFGVGNSAGTVLAKIVGWTRAQNASGVQWIPTTLFSGTLTLGTTTGPTDSAGPVKSTDQFAGTIAVAGSLVANGYVLEPADNGIQVLHLPVIGCQRLQMIVSTGTNVTKANGLYAQY